MEKGVKQQPPARYLDPNHKIVPISHLWELNVDCLTKLFAFLSKDDLKNLAQTHPIFLHVSSTILCARWQKYGIDTVFVNYGTNSDDILNFPTSKHIHVTHQTLRIFGKYVKKLHCSVRDQALISELIKFCPNIEELIIEGAFNNSSGSNLFCKPLKYLKKLHFLRGELCQAITKFKSWCPNLNYLKFETIYNIADRDCINFHFPQLKHFIIVSASPFKMENIQMMINKNPQIKVMEIDCPHFDVESINFLCNNFESLEKLKIRLKREFEPVFRQEQFHKLKCVKEVEIHCWHLWDSTLLLVSKYFPNINMVTIKTLDGNDTFMPKDDIILLDVMPTLKELSLQFNVFRDDQLALLLRFSSKIPSLTELYVQSNVRNIEIFNQCFVKFTQLQHLDFSGRASDYEDEYIEKFNVNFHRRFNRIVGNRDAAKMDILIETAYGARYNVNKQHIARNLKIICTNLSYHN